jgi:hypothetical protein
VNIWRGSTINHRCVRLLRRRGETRLPQPDAMLRAGSPLQSVDCPAFLGRSTALPTLGTSIRVGIMSNELRSRPDSQAGLPRRSRQCSNNEIMFTRSGRMRKPQLYVYLCLSESYWLAAGQMEWRLPQLFFRLSCSAESTLVTRPIMHNHSYNPAVAAFARLKYQATSLWTLTTRSQASGVDCAKQAVQFFRNTIGTLGLLI